MYIHRGRGSGAWVLGWVLFSGIEEVVAGTLSLNMTAPTQCGHSIVQWWGDNGPYHLLLTPTTIVQHSYNVWIPSIPDGTNFYNLSINQPAGLGFMITMWGEGGISKAGTTDIFTVGASPTKDSSCYLTDQAILSLYTFSFNITSTYDDFPPQCSNLSMSWPSSLESNVTGVTKRSITDLSTSSNSLEIRDTSSSSDTGNTTSPPTMFGIIPLGNSFSIPITYSTSSKFAKSLPASSLSDTPTTYTSQGVTHLNWTIDMAKGTRFVLVAGVGSDMQWASGGSSRMMTVGQGSQGCVGSEQSGGGAPSVTATGTGDPAVSATQVPDDGSSSPSPAGSLVRTIVASVLSVIGTLLVVGSVFLCWRIRKRRQAARGSGDFSSNATVDRTTGRGKAGGFKKLIGRKVAPPNPLRTETQLDLIDSRDGGVRNPPILVPLRSDSPLASPASDNLNPFRDPTINSSNRSNQQTFIQPYLPSGGNTPLTSSPISPVETFGSRGFRDIRRGDSMARHPSQDALLPYMGYNTPPVENSTMMTNTSGFTRGPLMLHEPLDQLPDHRDGQDGEGDGDGDISDLKRDTLAYLGSSSMTNQLPPGAAAPRGQGSMTARRGGRGGSGGSGGGRRNIMAPEEETSYMVHRDAGRVVELPPRYDQLNWADEGEGRSVAAATGESRDGEGQGERERQTQ